MALQSLAGIAPYFHLYDINGKAVKSSCKPAPGPGIWYRARRQLASLADMDVTVLVAQRVPGPKMHDVLIERNIRLVRRLGTVQDVVDELKRIRHEDTFIIYLVDFFWPLHAWSIGW